jgi:ribonuclease R
MGDKVMIKVVAANLVKRQLDYEWVPSVQEEEAEKPPVKKGRTAATRKRKSS